MSLTNIRVKKEGFWGIKILEGNSELGVGLQLKLRGQVCVLEPFGHVQVFMNLKGRTLNGLESNLNMVHIRVGHGILMTYKVIMGQYIKVWWQ